MCLNKTQWYLFVSKSKSAITVPCFNMLITQIYCENSRLQNLARNLLMFAYDSVCFGLMFFNPFSFIASPSPFDNTV